MGNIVLSDEEKECLESLIETCLIANRASWKAAKMELEADRALWRKIKKMHPDAINLKHPKEGKWELVCNDE